MGIFSKFENKMEDTFDNIGDKMFDAPISPVQIAKKAEKQMRRGKMVGAGKQYAPTLYTVLVNPDDDRRLSGYYPTLAGETETYLKAKANEAGLAMDGQPLVRFFTDPDLKSGKFDVIAEAVSAAIVEQLRVEEITNYGIVQNPANQDMQNSPQGESPVNPVNPANAANAAFQAAGQNAFQQPGQDMQSLQDQALQVPSEQAPASQAPATNDPFAPSANFEEFQQQGEAYEKNEMENAFDQVNTYDQANYDEANAQSFQQDDLQSQQNQVLQDDRAPQVQQPMQQNVNGTVGAVNGSGNGSVDAPNGAAGVSGAASAAAPTMVFAGGMQPQANDASRMAATSIPPAHLRDNASGKVYTLNTPTIVLGRDNTCGVVIADANASRQHAQILFNQGIWMLNDLGSTNGTFINGQEITTRQLNAGDVITIGVTHLTFNIG